MESEKTEAYWPVGEFICRGYYYLDYQGAIVDDEKKEFCLHVKIEDDDYDYDSAFADDEFDRIIQEKVAEKLPENHFDINITETEEK